MKRTLTIIVALALTGGACKKDTKKEEAPPPAEKTAEKQATPATTTPETPPKPSPEEEAKKAAARMAEVEKEIAEDKARFTPELEKEIAALAAKKFPDAKAALAAILKSPHRHAENPPRDAHRHPVETLTFFGVTPKSTVVELGAGEGWYTELLAPLLAREGKLIVVANDATPPIDTMSKVYGKRAELFLAKSPALYGKVEKVAIAPPDKLTLGPDGSADVVIAMREMHGWQNRGQLDAYVKAVHAVLKPGGVFGVEQHRAAAGARPEDTSSKGYLPEEWVIQQVTAAGFELAEKSEINANPKDTKDHEKGVWMLPPNMRDVPEADKAKYAAIGESDRMTLKFVKKK